MGLGSGPCQLHLKFLLHAAQYVSCSACATDTAATAASAAAALAAAAAAALTSALAAATVAVHGKNKPNDPEYCQKEVGAIVDRIKKCKQLNFIDDCERSCGFCTPTPSSPPLSPPPSPPPPSLCVDKNKPNDPEYCQKDGGDDL